MTAQDAALIKLLLTRDMSQHDIASLFGVNQGRIAEVNMGARFPGVPAADLHSKNTIQDLFTVIERWQMRMKAQIQRIFAEETVI